jgi:hypothetical protein
MLKDEDEMINIIVRTQVYGRCRHIIREAQLLLAEDKIQREDQMVNVLMECVMLLGMQASTS